MIRKSIAIATCLVVLAVATPSSTAARSPCDSAISALKADAASLTVSQAYARVLELKAICQPDLQPTLQTARATPVGSTTPPPSETEPSACAYSIESVNVAYARTICQAYASQNFALPDGCAFEAQNSANADSLDLSVLCDDQPRAIGYEEILDQVQAIWESLPEEIGTDHLNSNVCEGAGAGTIHGTLVISSISYPSTPEAAAGNMQSVSNGWDQISSYGPTWGFVGSPIGATIRFLAAQSPALDPGVAVNCTVVSSQVCPFGGWSCKKAKTVVVESGDASGDLIDLGTVKFAVSTHLEGGAA